MPTNQWIADHYPPDFMADMLADVVGDFTDVKLHPAIPSVPRSREARSILEMLS